MSRLRITQLSPGGTVKSNVTRERTPIDDLLAIADRLATDFQVDPAFIVIAAELAAFAPELDPQRQLTLTLLAALTLLSLFEGSTRLPLDHHDPNGYLHSRAQRLYDAAADLLPPDHPLLTLLSHDHLPAAIDDLLAHPHAAPLIGLPGDPRPLLLSDGALYQQRVLDAERHLAELVASRLRDLSPDDHNPALHAALQDTLAHMPAPQKQPLLLTREQEDAVHAALRHPLTLVSGGPGTGKTSMVVSLLRAAVRAQIPPESIALAAPTGKAAKRMGDAVREQLATLDPLPPPDRDLLERLDEPTTLHRLLGYSPRHRSFRFHALNPLPHKLVVVDEASMIDLFLMDALLDALDPGTNLVLLGDADQLPSVDTGAVFRDLIPRGDPDAPPALLRCAVRLLHNFRMRDSDPDGRSVLQTARWIQAAAPLEDLTGPHGCATHAPDLASLRYRGVEVLDARTPLLDLLDAWFDRWLDPRHPDAPLPAHAPPILHLDGVFPEDQLLRLQNITNHLARVRLLALTRILHTGADNLNRILHTRWVHARDLHPSTEFAEGEPIMMTRNDYDAGLFNGDQGVVLRLAVRPGDEAGSLRAVFPTRDGFRIFDLQRIAPFLELAFATTVHKSQGSEFRHVAVVLPQRDMPLLTRELLYTAVTRASRSVTLYGDPLLLAAAAARTATRSSGLRSRVLHAL